MAKNDARGRSRSGNRRSLHHATLSTKTFPRKVRGNCRSLGFARDDKGKCNGSIGSGCWPEAFFITLVSRAPMTSPVEMTTDKVARRIPPNRPSVAGTGNRPCDLPTRNLESSARDDKFIADEDLSPRPEESWACGPPKVMKNTSDQHPLPMEPLHFPLSSRAKPRDLQFHCRPRRPIQVMTR